MKGSGEHVQTSRADKAMARIREILLPNRDPSGEDCDTATCQRCGNFMDHRGGDGYECDPCAQELLELVREATREEIGALSLSPMAVENTSLRRERDEAAAGQVRWNEMWNEQFAVLEKVRDLHHPSGHETPGLAVLCSTCGDQYSARTLFPCPTRKLLDEYLDSAGTQSGRGGYSARRNNAKQD